ncbi:AAA family ATPase [Methanobrevibacter sp.]|uniref:AAA family ATPase n=1 Tax=Methanobrevibacter sp. TaxID=66852 RepID=UPI0025DB2DB1|nr:AAA family ATPase [Methanobrevibacter sp.]MBQ2665584.1 AAA family ATPase [Methanobrevibacter sp.]
MLEWTICTKCGKVLDNSKASCPDCGMKTDKLDMSALKGHLSNVTFLVRTLDIELIRDYCPKISALDTGIDVIVLDDLFRYFSFLGLGDGVVTDNELSFINELLDSSYTRDDIMNLSGEKADGLPESFECLHELDMFAQNFDMTGVKSCSELFESYRFLGKFFITVDGQLDEDVLDKYTDFIDDLRDNLGDYLLEDDGTTVQIPKPVEEAERHSLDEYLDELNRLIGLEDVKRDVNSLINLVRIRKLRQERGIAQPPMSLHLVFSGNPGTGKTTVARLLSKIYHEIGLLSKGHLIETDRSGLVGGYVGQTAIKTREVIDTALGGILFIDEAYSLASTSENDYGREAIDTILKAMEDNRDDFIVIVAGYPALMDRFLHSNPGLESRFNKFIYFDDYTAEELYDIFMLLCGDANLSLDGPADDYARQYFEKMYEHKSSNFANGRAVRNFFEEVITAQANRLAPKENITDDELNTLTYEDFLVEE